ncbi:MAG: hypothetical protein QOH48_848 [Actinomycetota bacterium]|nr:hypothetical protein [Actinomycetota bacterium]
MLSMHRAPRATTRVLVVVLIAVVTSVWTGVASASSGPNLLGNGTFEAGTTTGWTAVGSTLTVASDAFSGSWDGKAANNGVATFGLRAVPRPVTRGTAGAQYTASGMVRSDTPGGSVCIFLIEYSSGGSQVHQTSSCTKSQSSWSPLADNTVSLANADDSLSMVVREKNAAVDDSFEVDNLSLSQQTFTPTDVGLWTMNETSGGTMLDSGAAPANDGTLNNVTLGVPGVDGSTGYGFTRGYVSVPDDPSLNPGSANVKVSISADPSSLPTSGDFDVMRKGDSPAQQIKMELLQSGALLCSFRGTSGSKEVSSTVTLLPNTGYHTLQCVKTTTQIQAVVDGSVSVLNATIGCISNTAPVVIGAHGDGSYDFYRGSLDEAVITIG